MLVVLHEEHPNGFFQEHKLKFVLKMYDHHGMKGGITYSIESYEETAKLLNGFCVRYDCDQYMPRMAPQDELLEYFKEKIVDYASIVLGTNLVEDVETLTRL